MRRIGVDTLSDRLEIYWKPLLIAATAASVITPIILWVRCGWPPEASSRLWVFVWSGVFALMVLPAAMAIAQERLWGHLSILLILMVLTVCLMSFVAGPILGALELAETPTSGDAR